MLKYRLDLKINDNKVNIYLTKNLYFIFCLKLLS